MTTETLTITDFIACYCPVGSLGHAWNPTPGWCPNPHEAEPPA